jgi:hypothetical protein
MLLWAGGHQPDRLLSKVVTIWILRDKMIQPRDQTHSITSRRWIREQGQRIQSWWACSQARHNTRLTCWCRSLTEASHLLIQSNRRSPWTSKHCNHRPRTGNSRTITRIFKFNGSCRTVTSNIKWVGLTTKMKRQVLTETRISIKATTTQIDNMEERMLWTPVKYRTTDLWNWREGNKTTSI